MNNKKLFWLTATIVLIALIGFIDATYLTIKHFQGESPRCLTSGECNIVTSSQYSEIAGMPVALLGMLYYGSVLLGGILYLDAKNKKFLRALSWYTIAGLLTSIWFVYLQLFVIHAICTYCMVSAITSTLLFLLGLGALFCLHKQDF